jgi:hypothetical protein
MTQQAGGAKVVAVSDAWATRMDRAEKLIGSPVAKHADYRRVLDTKDIDAVNVATLDHWHSRMAIDACRAGKDVFVEKPMTSLPEQGPPLVRAVKETDRILQVGVQQRSLKHFSEAKKRFFDSGLIGDVHMVRTWWNYPQKVNVSFEATISDRNAKESVDIVFLGTKGRLHIFRHGYRFIPAGKGAAEITAGPSPESDHMKNWLECVRSRKQPNANVVDGHYGAMACHLGNLAYRRKARVEW